MTISLSKKTENNIFPSIYLRNDLEISINLVSFFALPCPKSLLLKGCLTKQKTYFYSLKFLKFLSIIERIEDLINDIIFEGFKKKILNTETFLKSKH